MSRSLDAEVPARPDDPGARRRRREFGLALAGSAAAGALALSAGSQRWLDVTITRTPPLPPANAVLSGSSLAPLVPACGLLLLAAAVAVVAVRGAGRVLLGVLVVAAGGALGVSAVRALSGGLGAGAADLTDVVGLGDARITSSVVTVWPVLALVAGVLAVGAGLLVVLRGRSWPGMGRRYERAGAAAAPAARRRPARPESPEDRHQAAWKALDRGEDPTADPADVPAPGPADDRTV